MELKTFRGREEFRPMSMKARTLACLKIMLKHSDKDHPLTFKTLNEHLDPLGLAYKNTTSVTAMLAEILEAGFDVRRKGHGESYCFWIENHPLKEETLKKLIFAVSSNPYINNNETSEIFKELNPSINEYQEELFLHKVISIDEVSVTGTYIDKYLTILNAIRQEKLISFKQVKFKHHKKINETTREEIYPQRYFPIAVYTEKLKLYMYGYNRIKKELDSVLLDDMLDLKVVRIGDTENEYYEKMIKAVTVAKLPGPAIEEHNIIYTGPARIWCTRKHLPIFHELFGTPDTPIKKSKYSFYSHYYENISVTDKILYALMSIPPGEIKVSSPQKLLFSIEDYLNKTKDALFNTRTQPDK